MSDEEIFGKEPTLEEQGLIDENNKLKVKIVNLDEELEISQYALEKITTIVKGAIDINLRKTRRSYDPPTIKKYREELLTLRAIEKELTDYNNRLMKIIS